MWTESNHKLGALSILEGWNTGMLEKWVLASGSEEFLKYWGKRSYRKRSVKIKMDNLPLLTHHPNIPLFQYFMDEVKTLIF